MHDKPYPPPGTTRTLNVRLCDDTTDQYFFFTLNERDNSKDGYPMNGHKTTADGQFDRGEPNPSFSHSRDSGLHFSVTDGNCDATYYRFPCTLKK